MALRWLPKLTRRMVYPNDRVYADAYLPLLEFEARRDCRISLRSWRLVKTIRVSATDEAYVELWTAIVADGAITYSVIAAGYRSDGMIAALACIEAAPSLHDFTYLGVFEPNGCHRNLGTVLPGADLVATTVSHVLPYLSA